MPSDFDKTNSQSHKYLLIRLLAPHLNLAVGITVPVLHPSRQTKCHRNPPCPRPFASPIKNGQESRMVNFGGGRGAGIAIALNPVLSIWEKPIPGSLSELYFLAFDYKF